MTRCEDQAGCDDLGAGGALADVQDAPPAPSRRHASDGLAPQQRTDRLGCPSCRRSVEWGQRLLVGITLEGGDRVGDAEVGDHRADDEEHQHAKTLEERGEGVARRCADGCSIGGHVGRVLLVVRSPSGRECGVSVYYRE